MVLNKLFILYSEIHMKQINTLCGQNSELLNVKAWGTYSYHWTLKGLRTSLFFVHILSVYRITNTQLILDIPVWYNEIIIIVIFYILHN
jgi:hypothetical protein